LVGFIDTHLITITASPDIIFFTVPVAEGLMVVITVPVVAAVQELVVGVLVVAAAVILRQKYLLEPHYHSLMSYPLEPH
jgi:hypothetical protein